MIFRAASVDGITVVLVMILIGDKTVVEHQVSALDLPKIEEEIAVVRQQRKHL